MSSLKGIPEKVYRFPSNVINWVQGKRYEIRGRDILSSLTEGTHLVRYDPEELLEKIDGWSGGLVSACRPEGEIIEERRGGGYYGRSIKIIPKKLTEGELSWRELFQLSYEELVSKPGRLGIDFGADYESPIGVIRLKITTPPFLLSLPGRDGWGLPKDILKKEFPTKEEVDVFLTKLNDQHKGLLEEMVEDFKLKYGTYYQPSEITELEFRIRSANKRQTSFGIFTRSTGDSYGSKDRRFMYTHPEGTHLWNISEKTLFENFNQTLEVGRGKIILDGTLAARLAYKRISVEKTRETVNQQIEEYFRSNPALRDLPPIELKFDAEATEINDEGIKKMSLEGEEEGVKYRIDCSPKEPLNYTLGVKDEIRGWHSMVGWNYQNPIGLNAYKNQIDIEHSIDPKTGRPKLTLIGDALLVTKLARELSGVENYGLLKAE